MPFTRSMISSRLNKGTSDMATKIYLPTKANQEATDNKIDALQTDVTAVKADVSTVKSDTTTLKSDASTVKSDITTLKSDTTTLKTDVSAIKTDASTIKSDTTTLKTDVSTVKTDVEALGTKADTAQTALAALSAKVDALKATVPGNACIVVVELNKEGASYSLPESEAKRAALLEGAKAFVWVTGYADPMEVPVWALEGFCATVAVPASEKAKVGRVSVRLGDRSYAVKSVSFSAVAGVTRNVSLVTSPMTGTLVEVARCQPWNSTADGDGSSFLMTEVTTSEGTVRYVGHYDSSGVFHGESKTSVYYWKCPKDSDGNAATPVKMTSVDGGENAVDVMERLSVLSSIKKATVKIAGDSASLDDNVFIRFTGPLYVKTSMETVPIPVLDEDGAETDEPTNLYCCVKRYCCDFASDADAAAHGYHRHPFFVRYERSGETYSEIPVSHGYVARYPINKYDLVCGGTKTTMACSKSDGSNEVGGTRYQFLDWCNAVRNATVTVSVDGEEDVVIESVVKDGEGNVTSGDVRAVSMFDLRELSFMQWMSYLFFGVDVQSTMKGICTNDGDAYVQQSNGRTDYILDQGIWTGGEDPTSSQKQVVFLGVEGGIWSAPGMMYPNFTSIAERVTRTGAGGTYSTSTRNRYLYAVDRADYDPGSSDEARLLTRGYRQVPFLVGSGNKRQGACDDSMLRDAYLPVSDGTMANITVGGKDTHWQGGAPGEIAAFSVSTAYSAGSLCRDSGKLYRCVKAIFAYAVANAYEAGSIVTYGGAHYVNTAAVVAYADDIAFAAGDFCVCDGVVYSASEAVTGEKPGESEKWTVVDDPTPGVWSNWVSAASSPGSAAEWTLVTNETITAQNYYMVAIGSNRYCGSSLGAFCVDAAGGLANAHGDSWRSRLSLQPVS